jgi:hypothetical protein
MRSPARSPAHRDHATAHAAHRARQGAAEEIAGVTLDDDAAALHLRRCPGSDAASHAQAPALQALAEIGAGIALDRDRAALHVAADEVQPRGRIANDYLAGIAGGDGEHLAHRNAPVAARQLDLRDVAWRHVAQALRRQRREIDALARRRHQRENQGAHCMSFRRWKWNWPSLPP